MKIRVKLFGTLSLQIAGYDPEQGLELLLPDGAMAGDLLARLNISDSRQVIIASGGRLLKSDDVLSDEMYVQLLQPVSGG